MEQARRDLPNMQPFLAKNWDMHHILPIKKGGNNRLSNLQLLHINCHRHVIAKDLNVKLVLVK